MIKAQQQLSVSCIHVHQLHSHVLLAFQASTSCFTYMFFHARPATVSSSFVRFFFIAYESLEYSSIVSPPCTISPKQFSPITVSVRFTFYCPVLFYLNRTEPFQPFPVFEFKRLHFPAVLLLPSESSSTRAFLTNLTITAS